MQMMSRWMEWVSMSIEYRSRCNLKSPQKQSIALSKIKTTICNEVLKREKYIVLVTKIHGFFLSVRFGENNSGCLYVTYVELSSNVRTLQYVCMTPESSPQIVRIHLVMDAP